jgi:hypothetical protein
VVSDVNDCDTLSSYQNFATSDRAAGAKAALRSPSRAEGETMRSIVTVIVVATFGLLGSAAIAAQRPALCKLVVMGKAYIDGRCDFEVDPDGSFRIFGATYFAYVFVNGNTATASWNRDPKSTHAGAPLGALTRNGACWENATAQICARSLGANK